MNIICYQIKPLYGNTHIDNACYDTLEEAVQEAKELLPKHKDAYGVYSYCYGIYSNSVDDSIDDNDAAQLIAIVSLDTYSQKRSLGPQVFIKLGIKLG